jgi:hypothetical protein
MASFADAARKDGATLLYGPAVDQAIGQGRRTVMAYLGGKPLVFDAIFTPNESSTATVLALRQLQRAGRYDFVGVDRNPVIVEAVRNGEMLATMVQDSEKMAALAVEMADAAIKAPASTGRNILPPFVMDRRCCAMPAEPKNQRMKTANVRLCQYYFEQEQHVDPAVAGCCTGHLPGALEQPSGLDWLLLAVVDSGHSANAAVASGKMRSLLTDPARLQKYFSTFYVSVFAAAVAWGSMLFAFPHRQFDFVYMFKIIALAAINSVTILSHGLIFRLYALFSTVMTVMVFIQLHGFDQVMSASDRYAFSVIALLYLLFLLLTAWKYARRNFDFFEQQVAMESLVSKLKRLHDEEVDCAPAWRPSLPGWKRRAMRCW